MKKSLRKILFAILTVFAVFFVVACGNKEDAKINKEEVLQKNVEATNNIKSANKLVTAKVEIEGGQTIEYTFDISLIKDPFALKTILGAKGEDAKITTFIKDSMMYVTSTEDDTWEQQAIPEETIEGYKNILNDSIEIYEVLKDNLDKISIKEDGGNYIISAAKNSDFLNEYLKSSLSDTIGQNTDLKPNNATLEYIIDKETYFTKSLVLTFDAEVQGQKLKAKTETTFSNINSVGEITVPEEALNSNN